MRVGYGADAAAERKEAAGSMEAASGANQLGLMFICWKKDETRRILREFSPCETLLFCSFSGAARFVFGRVRRFRRLAGLLPPPTQRVKTDVAT